jgi:hypothetical protein
MSEQTSAIQGFETPERATLAHAIATYVKAQADAQAAARRVRRALAAVAQAEGARMPPRSNCRCLGGSQAGS